MINVNQITAQMARMSDPALQQFAAMHKSDPYTLSLALSESNRRKQMRQGAPAGAPQQPQPKVVDQEVAQMASVDPMGNVTGLAAGGYLPEEIGIGQLPAPNMKGMAAGGIVAFEEGGEVPRFQVGGGVGGGVLGDLPPGMTDSKAYAEALSKYKEGRPLSGVEKALLFTAKPLAAAADVALLPFTGLANALHNPLDKSPRPSITPVADARERALYGDQPAAAPVAATRAPGAYDAGIGLNVMAPAPGAAPAPSANPAGGIKPGGGQGLNPAAGGQGLMTGIPGLTQTATGTAQEFQNMRDQFGQPTVSQAVKDQINTYRQAREEDTQAALKELKADQEKQGLGMEAAEKRTKERGEKLSKREADLPGLAIFQAGLAIMGGESPYALTNMGKGAGLGLKMYTEGLDKLEASREKLDESFDKIEMFRQNRADMNAKEVRAAQKDIRATKTEAEKLGLDALVKEGDMNRADARAAFGVMSENRAKMYGFNVQERLGLAQISAQKEIAGNRNKLMEDLYGGEVKARAEFGKIQQQVMRGLEKDFNYTNETSDVKKQAMLNAAMQRAMQSNPFLAPYTMGIGFQKAPPPGTVTRSLEPE